MSIQLKEEIETLYYDENIGVIKATQNSICRINFRTKSIDYITRPVHQTEDPLHMEVMEWVRIDKFELRKMCVPRTAVQCCIESIRENPNWVWK